MHKYNLHGLFFLKDLRKGNKWVKEIIIKLFGNKWVLVNTCDEMMYKRHVNKLRHRELSQEVTESQQQSSAICVYSMDFE